MREIISMIIKSLCLEGEIFFMLTNDGMLQAIEPIRIQSKTKDKAENEIDGIRFNKNGKPTSYRICQLDSSGKVDILNGRHVAARNIIHIANRTRINSLRGIPMLGSCVNQIKDVAELVRATIQKSKISACLTAFVTLDNPHAERWNQNGYDEPARSENLDLRSGAIYLLNQGESLQVVESKANVENIDQFIEQRVSDILAVLGLTTSVLKGFDKTSYASSRATRSITSHTFKLWRTMLEEKFLSRVQFWKASKMVKIDQLPESEEQTSVEFPFITPPSLDKKADYQADAVGLSNGLQTLSDVLGEKGGEDWQDKMEQRAIELAKAQELAKKYQVPVESLLPNYIESVDT